jgi:hypothetical protein
LATLGVLVTLGILVIFGDFAKVRRGETDGSVATEGG